MRPTPLPADDTPTDPESERLADLDDRLRGDGPPPSSGIPTAGDVDVSPPLAIDDVDLLLRLNQAGASYRERTGGQTLPEMKRFGRFEIVREAGRGGFATVYESVDTFLRRRVALKVAHPGVLVSETLRARFLREAELASRLNHPRLVTIHEYGECDGLCYITEEFCDGGSLAAWLATRPGPVEPRLAAAIVLAIAEGLQVAHAAGISHRDIKPENILLCHTKTEKPVIPGEGTSAGWTIKLGDFGLGTISEEASEGTTLVQLTREGTRLGTPAWMAPEQIDRAIGPIGPATDVHALGLLLDRLLTGRSRWVGESDSETLRMILLGDPLEPDRALRGVPADLVAVGAKSLAKRPIERYPSAAELASDLARYLLGLPTVARPITPLERGWRFVSRRPTASALAVAAVFMTLVAGWGLRDRARQAAEIERTRIERQHLDAALEVRRAADSLRTGSLASAVDHLRAAAVSDPALAASDAGRWLARRLHGEVAMLLEPPSDSRSSVDDGSVRLDLYCLATSPDGRILAAGGADGRLRLVRLDTAGHTPEPPQSIAAHDEINDVAFSPDGSLVATAGEDGRVRLFRTADGTPAREIGAEGSPLFAVAFSPDGDRLAWAGGERVIRIAPVTGPAVGASEPLALKPFDAAADDSPPDIESMLFLDDRRMIVSCGSRVAVIDLQDGSIEREFIGHDRRSVVGHLAMSADGSRLLTAGTDKVPRVWEIATGLCLLTLPRHPNWVQGGGFTPDGRGIVTGCKDGVIRLFDATTGALRNRLVGHVGRTWDVRCDARGAVLSAGADGTVRRWDPARPAELAGTRMLSVPGGTLLSVVARPAGEPSGADGSQASDRPLAESRSMVFVSQPTGPPLAVDVATGESRPVKSEVSGASRMSIDPTGRRLVLHASEGAVTVQPLEGGPALSIPGIERAHSSVWTATGQLVVSDFERNLWVCDGALTRAVKIDSFPHFIDTLALSPVDGQRVAAGGGDLIRLHQIPAGRLPTAGSGRTLIRLPPEFGKVYRLAWSHDGRRLAVGSGLGRVCVIDADRGNVVGTVASHAREIVALAWSPDDRILFTADLESVRVSDTVTMVMIDELRPGFDIQGMTFVEGATSATGSTLVIAGGSSTPMASIDGESVSARLLVVDLDRPVVGGR
jgi:eukaryotic-like serine/threonine-protein kinase